MTCYPVIIPTLNRYEHLKECVESLAACTHADKTELVIGLDYPPAEKYKDGWKKIKDYLPQIKGFSKVTVFEHDKNLGPNDNENFLRNYVFQHYEAYIFSEDDNIFSPCFLDYMNKCLEKYKDDQKIICVCGCLEPGIQNILKPQADGKNSVLKVIGNQSEYGIGIWRDKEIKLRNKFPADIKKYIFSSRYRILKLCKSPAKLNHIYFWLEKKPELNYLCDFTRNAWMVLYDQINLLPITTLTINKGFDGSGANCGFSTEEQNIWESLKLPEQTEYEIIDNNTKKDIKVNSRKIFKAYPKHELKEIFPLLCLYLIFGYHITEWFIRTKKKYGQLFREKKHNSFMKRLQKKYEIISEQDQKKYLIAALDWLQAFCNSNNIRCYLHAGTLLGAVRHKGFIPWDDDIDVCMPRPDYERFRALMKQTEADYYLADYSNMKYYPTPFAKLALKNTDCIMNYKRCGYGLYIDIFPIDGFPTDENERNEWFSGHKKFFFEAYLDNVNFELYGNKNPLRFLKKKIKNLLMNSNKAARIVDQNAAKNDFESSLYAGSSCGIFRGKPEVAPKESFEKGIDFEFEGKTYKGPVGWKDILTSIYGPDFMTPPPEQDRKSTHDELFIKRK